MVLPAPLGPRNAKISPACLYDVTRLEGIRSYAFLGRWGTFRFDVVLPLERVEGRRVADVGLELIALCNDAVENAIASIVDDRVEQLLEVRILAEHRELELAQLENHALLQAILERLNRPAWYRRALAWCTAAATALASR